jgi:drug/metabolite transporter (DMT)-like permease
MSTWQFLAVFTPVLFVTYQTISKFLPKDAPIFLINAIASFVGALVMLLFHFFFSARAQTINPKTIPLIIAIGLLISVGNFLIIKAYSLGAPQSSFTALFYPLLIVYGALYGYILWQERFSGIQGIGFLLIGVGLVLVSFFKKGI